VGATAAGTQQHRALGFFAPGASPDSGRFKDTSISHRPARRRPGKSLTQEWAASRRMA
jgi:hypothetical protein